MPRRTRRRLQREWKQSLTNLALLLALCQMPAFAATINVGPNCTLINAINSANSNTAMGGCAKGSGADTIVLPANSTQTLTAVNNQSPWYGQQHGPTGLPVIKSVITISGNNSTIRRPSTAPAFRIFALANGPDPVLTLQRTTVSGGLASGTAPKNRGGAIYNDHGSVYLNNSTLSNNKAQRGGGVYGNEAVVNLTNSTISGNSGSGIFGTYTGVMLTNSVVSNNTGTGITRTGPVGRLVASNSTVSNNSGTGVLLDEQGSSGPHMLTNTTIAGNGGTGLKSVSANTTVIKSTISGNGSVGLEAQGVGSYTPYRLSITNSTISGNTNSGVRSAASTMVLTNSTIVLNGGDGVGGYENSATDVSTITLSRTLVSGNARVFGNEVYQSPYSAITGGNFNLFGHSGITTYGLDGAFFNFSPGATDITATSDGNRPTALGSIFNNTLANHGGPTRTHVLPAGSPATDGVTNGTCPPPATDQRNISRPRDGNSDGGVACDIGAFER